MTRDLKTRSSNTGFCGLSRVLWRGVARPVFLLAVCLLLSGVSVVVDPYAGVDWSQVQQHQGNLHTHTTQSDGRMTPDQVVDEYHARGYTILSLTEHNLCTWPWTEFATMERKGRAFRADLAAAKEAAGEEVPAKHREAPVPPYENRDPAALGMLAIPGNEASLHHHTCVLFVEYEPPARELEQTLKEVAAAGGLAVLNHPGRYWEKNEAGEIPGEVVARYVSWMREHEILLGLEVINQGMRYRHDIELWDKVLAECMPDRPVWGYANDDMHAIGALGRDSSMFLLTELTAGELRAAIMRGCSYMRSVSTHEGEARDMAQTPVITSIQHEAQAGTIAIAATSGGQPLADDRYRWVSNGQTVHTGPVLDYQNTDGLGNYVRAELRGDGGTAFTNPFGLDNP